jgi:hypothetical protein
MLSDECDTSGAEGEKAYLASLASSSSCASRATSFSFLHSWSSAHTVKKATTDEFELLDPAFLALDVVFNSSRVWSSEVQCWRDALGRVSSPCSLRSQLENDALCRLVVVFRLKNEKLTTGGFKLIPAACGFPNGPAEGFD